MSQFLLTSQLFSRLLISMESKRMEDQNYKLSLLYYLSKCDVKKF